MDQQDRRTNSTRFLSELVEGDSAATGRLMPLVYSELRGLAASLFRDGHNHVTMQPTALAHEAFLRLITGEPTRWESRAHFFAVAAKAMRNILVDEARRRVAKKRGGDWQRMTLSALIDSRMNERLDVLDLHEALTRLADRDARQASIVELRFFGGLSVNEVAQLIDVSPRTVELDWRMARAWLRRALAGGEASE